MTGICCFPSYVTMDDLQEGVRERKGCRNGNKISLSLLDDCQTQNEICNHIQMNIPLSKLQPTSWLAITSWLSTHGLHSNVDHKENMIREYVNACCIKILKCHVKNVYSV